MGSLRGPAPHDLQFLPRRCLIGRSRDCDLVLAGKDVSSQHAEVKWTGMLWELHDLASRNGTFLDDRRLAPGERAPLREGSRVRFASRGAAWELVDVSPPQPMARTLDDGRVRTARGGLLSLPDDERPEVVLYTQGPDQWVAERGTEIAGVRDRQLLSLAGGTQWRLHLSAEGTGTLEEVERTPQIADLKLCFRHSRDEEYVELTATVGALRIDLQARTHHYSLLLLARQRMADQARGVPPADQGWLLQDKLLDMLQIDASRLNIDVHRARRQLSDAGVTDAGRLIERRTGTRQLRLGVEAFEIACLTDVPE